MPSVVCPPDLKIGKPMAYVGGNSLAALKLLTSSGFKKQEWQSQAGEG